MKQPAKPAAFLIDKDYMFKSPSMYLCGVVWCVQLYIIISNDGGTQQLSN
ncbi:hypothetical protein PATY110618_15200 [Paenibacillus typhae]|uniref:Uncharacterized protein n=1 Tax=Paenibacillus typhae TaxID=1174501 RepID=A0A1G8VUC9_9BACL|nr:hypothetical protein SAMN05216192_12231 [Paenibacillus typhae]